jgi:predicted transglutaminase-like protease
MKEYLMSTLQKEEDTFHLLHAHGRDKDLVVYDQKITIKNYENYIMNGS